VPEVAATFRITEVDGDAVRATCRSCIRIACSDADPYNPGGGGEQYGEALDAQIDVIPGAAHIGPLDGYGPWPSLEAWCLDPTVRLRPNLPALGG
jgi:uncharacterized protein